VHDVNPTSGGDKVRVVFNPNRPMRTVHQNLAAYLGEYVMPMTRRWANHATACRVGLSVIDDIALHRHARCIYVTDISQAFPSITAQAIAGCITQLEEDNRPGYVGLIVSYLERFCFEPGGKSLIVGGGASNLLFELYARLLIDRRIVERLETELNAWVTGLYSPEEKPRFANFMSCLGSNEVNSPILFWLRQEETATRQEVGIKLRYTRYLDDIKVSCDGPLPFKTWEKIKQIVRDVVREAGLKPNERKTHFYDLPRGPIQVNGIGLEYGGRLFMPRRYLDDCRRLMRRVEDEVAQLNEQYGDQHSWPNDQAALTASHARRVIGRLSHIGHILTEAHRYGTRPNGTDVAFDEVATKFKRQFGQLALKRPGRR
jgi:hypothetical protein